MLDAPRLRGSTPLLGAIALSACMTARPILVAPRGNEPAPHAVLFENVRIFDGVGDALSVPSDLLIDGGRITAMAPHGQLLDARMERAERVDGTGKTLLPGLIDCHVHLGGGDGTPPWDSKRPNVDAQSAALVYAGVTTILAAARDADFVGLRRRIAAGELAGPRIISSSRVFTLTGGHPVPFFKALLPWPVSSLIISSRVIQVGSEEEARSAVDKELPDGDPAFAKIMYDDIPPGAPHLSRELLKALIAEVRAKGRRASVHVGSPQDALDAVWAGASLLMHVPGNEPLTEAQARTLAASGVPIVTTVGIYAALSAALDGTLEFSKLEKEVMPPGTIESYANKPEHYLPPGFPQSYIDAIPTRAGYMARNARLLADAGAQLVAGTDSGLPAVFHGAALHRELRALVALGLTPARVLRMATADAARVLERGADYGSIAPGMRADLLLINGDPLVDIAATEQIESVWQDGRKLKR